jgi:hypothetical protein
MLPTTGLLSPPTSGGPGLVPERRREIESAKRGSSCMSSGSILMVFSTRRSVRCSPTTHAGRHGPPFVEECPGPTEGGDPAGCRMNGEGRPDKAARHNTDSLDEANAGLTRKQFIAGRDDCVLCQLAWQLIEDRSDAVFRGDWPAAGTTNDMLFDLSAGFR